MKKTALFLVLSVFCTVMNAQTVPAINSFPWYEGFEGTESDSFWTRYDLDGSTSDNWTRYSSSYNANSGSYSMRSSYNSNAAANDWLISPALELPNDAEGFVLQWWVRGSSYSGNSAHYTVLVSTSGTDTSAFTDTLWVEEYAATNYAQRSVALDAFAGQTIHFAIIHDSYNDNGLYIDDIAVRCTLLPIVDISGPTLANEGEEYVFHAILSEGATNNISYTWISSMNNANQAVLIADADSMTMIYSSGGMDTLQLIVSNDYGSDTASMIVRVCGSITAFPWNEGFEDMQSLACWTIGDYDGYTSDNWTRYSGSYNANSGNYSMRSSYNSSAAANDWLVTPPLAVPYDAEGYILKWHVRGSSYNGNEAHYTVLVSINSADTALFTDTLFAEAYPTSSYAKRTTSLDAYAGLTIRIAFVHDSYNDNSLFIDDISVYSALPPSVTIIGSTSATVGETTVFHATITEGATDNLDLEWSSSMAANGNATLIDDGDSVSIDYLTAGTDTLRVVATNDYGSDTAYIVVHVCGSVNTFPWTEDFSSSDALLCWTVLDLDGNNSDNWTRSTSYNGTMYSSYSYYTTNEWLITPSIAMPVDADGMVLTWDVRGSSYSGNNAHYTVLASTGSIDTADFLDTIYSESLSSGFITRTVPVNTFSGQTVRFAFIHDGHNDNGLYLDNIGIRSANQPIVTLMAPSTVFTEDSVHLTAILDEGSTTGITFTWHSTLLDSTLTTTDSNFTIVYHIGGTDTITIIVTNTYGTDTATAVVEIIDCAPIISFPWLEDFEDNSNLQCWIIQDNNASTSDNWTRYISYDGEACMRSNYNSSMAANEWLITPSLAIPTDANGLSLTWHVRGSSYQNYSPHYTVLISTGSSDTASFIDTLFAENYSGSYVNRTIGINAYAGQTVRIAFVHDSYNDNGLYLDKIAVRSTLAPVMTLSAPAACHTGDSVSLSATLTEGDTTGITLLWHSTLLGSTVTTNDFFATFVYTTGGTDTISVIAINAYGSDTATATITVIDCSPITTLPWSEDFEIGSNALECWTVINNNNYDNDNWTLVSSQQHVFDGDHCIGSSYRFNGSNDDYIVSPSFIIPDDATDLRLSYYVKGGSYGTNVTTYQTLVSTTGIAPSDFNDTLFVESYDGPYVRRSLSLAPYAGQTIRFAFHHISYNADNLFIDNIVIDFETAPQPDSCEAPSIAYVNENENSITLAWSGSAITHEVAIAAGSVANFATGTTTLSSTYTFTGLIPGTLYTVGVRGHCADGNVSEWTLQEVTTASAACLPPTDLTATEATHTGITLLWTPANNEIAWEVNIFSANPTYDSSFTTTQTAVEVNRLQPGRSYTARVRTRCSATTYSSWSNNVTFSTLNCSVPSGLDVSNIGPTSATVTWTSTEATNYEVSFGIGTYGDDGSHITSSTNSLQLTGLEPGMSYNVFVRALCDEDVHSGWSIRKQFTTASMEGIDDVDTENVVLYTLDGQIVIANGAGEEVNIYDMLGRKVDGGRKSRFCVPSSGTYIVRTGTLHTRKVVVIR